jgi:serine O-acetyltransferase
MIKDFSELKQYIIEDEIVNHSKRISLIEKLKNDKYKLLLFFRLSSYFFYKKNYILYKFCVLIYHYYRKKFNIDVKPDLKVGKGLHLPHPIGIVINSKSIIGEKCTILQNVTIGNKNKSDDVPILGNNVMIGAGAVLIGDIKIGNNVKIGANSVVITDIPDNFIVAGVPAKIIKKLDI